MKKFLIIGLCVVLLIPFVLADTDWECDPADCLTSYESQDCTGSETGCGYSASVFYCYEPSSQTLPVANSTTDSNADDGTCDGGWIINCLDYDGSAPHCDNSAAWWCDRNSTCSGWERDTVCDQIDWNTAPCDATCQSGHLDCDGDGEDCEIDNGAQGNCDASAHYDTSHACVSGDGYCDCDSGRRDCNNDDGDADEDSAQVGTACEVVDNAACDTNSHYDAHDACVGTSGACDCDSGYDDCNNDDGDGNQETGQFGSDGCEIDEYDTNYPTGANNRYNNNCQCICDSGWEDCDSGGCDAGDGCDTNTGAAECSGGANNHYECSGGAGVCYCDSGYLDCDEGGNASTNGCEIDEGLACLNSTDAGTGGTYESGECYASIGGNCTSSGTYLDCDDSDGDTNELTCNVGNGCEIQDGASCSVGILSGTYDGCSGGGGNCVVDVDIFETGLQINYSTSAVMAMLWGHDWGTGLLLNLSNDRHNLSYGVNASGVPFSEQLAGCNEDIETDSTGRFICGTDATGAGGGADINISGDGIYLYNNSPSTIMYLNESYLNISINNSIDNRVIESFLTNILDSTYTTITNLALNITDHNTSIKYYIDTVFTTQTHLTNNLTSVRATIINNVSDNNVSVNTYINAQDANIRSTITANISDNNDSVKSYIDLMSWFNNVFSFFNSTDNFTGDLQDKKVCIWNATGSNIVCNETLTSSSNTDTNASTACGDGEVLLGEDSGVCVSLNSSYVTQINLDNNITDNNDSIKSYIEDVNTSIKSHVNGLNGTWEDNSNMSTVNSSTIFGGDISGTYDTITVSNTQGLNITNITQLSDSLNCSDGDLMQNFTINHTGVFIKCAPDKTGIDWTDASEDFLTTGVVVIGTGLDYADIEIYKTITSNNKNWGAGRFQNTYSPSASSTHSYYGVGGWTTIGNDNIDGTASLDVGAIGLQFGTYTGTDRSIAGNCKGMLIYGMYSFSGSLTTTGNVTGIHVKPWDGSGWMSAADLTTPNLLGIKIDDASAASGGGAAHSITNQYQLEIDKPTRGTNNYQMVLNGVGDGSGIWLGGTGGNRIYTDSEGNLNFTASVSGFSGDIYADDYLEFSQDYNKRKYGNSLQYLNDVEDRITYDLSNEIVYNHDNDPLFLQKNITFPCSCTTKEVCMEIEPIQICNPINTSQCWNKTEECNIVETCKKCIHTSASLSMKVAWLRQVNYELLEKIDSLETRVSELEKVVLK